MKTNRSTQGYNKWNLPEGAKARLVPGAINDIQFSPDSTQLAVACGIGIWIYDAHAGEQLFLLAGHTRTVTSVMFSPTGRKLASGDQDGIICLWDVRTGTHLKTFAMNDINNVEFITFSPDRCTVAIVGRDDLPHLWEGSESSPRSLRLWEIATGKLCQTITGNILRVVFSADGRTLAISEYDWNGDFWIDLWDAATGDHLKTLTKTGSANSITLSPDGQTLAIGNHIWYSGIRLWNVATETHLNTLIGSKELEPVSSLAFSPDRGTLAAGCSDSTIYLWNVDTGKHAKTLTGHTSEISHLCFSPDGNVLASGCYDGTVLLWNVDLVEDNSIFAEEKTEFQNRTSQIQQICEERGITTLIHFTRIENLRNISQEGLIGRSLLEERRQQFLFNDNDRVDGHKDAVCLSISFPNYRMFYSIRERKKLSEGVDNSQWIVLLLDATVLWELECAFCQRNAAHKTVSSIPLEDRRKPEALKGMFEDFYNIRHQNLSIPQDYPTHPEAEVLVFDPIPVRYIKAIHFWDAASQESWLPSNTGGDYEASGTDRHYFKPRCDYEDWKPTDFNNEGIPLSYTAENNIDGISLQPQKTPAQTPVPDHPLVEDIDLGIDPNDPFADPDDEDDIPF